MKYFPTLVHDFATWAQSLLKEPALIPDPRRLKLLLALAGPLVNPGGEHPPPFSEPTEEMDDTDIFLSAK